MAAAHLSKDFADFVRSVGESKSKQVRARGDCEGVGVGTGRPWWW